MRTRVFITVDTEFSIGGAFDKPYGKTLPIGSQNVLCDVDGVSEGLGFILEALGAHGLVATFFVETMQTAFFGDGPMREVAQRIDGAGHDVELHLHPVWTYFDRPDWQRRLANEPPSDDVCERSVDLLASWISRGSSTFERWGIPVPVAMRTGNLRVDRNVYRAMSRTGMKVASNIGRAMFEPADRAFRCNGGIHLIEGITELPVLTYIGLKLGNRRQLKSLTIAGSSTQETIHLLERAHAMHCTSVVLLTHCHEFVRGDLRAGTRANRMTQDRLRKLCQFLADETDRFEVTSMAAVKENAADFEPGFDPLLEVPATLALRRIVQNKLIEYKPY